jgi:hypothetical protein
VIGESALRDSSPALTVTLELAVPLHIHELRHVPASHRLAVAHRSAQIVASQGDVLQYGGGLKFGHGAKELTRHQSGPRCRVEDCRCKGEGCASQKCYCHVRGEPSYSAGEVFNALAAGLAAAAFQPGGVTFGDLFWCAAHPRQHRPDGRVCPDCLAEAKPKREAVTA